MGPPKKGENPKVNGSPNAQIVPFDAAKHLGSGNSSETYSRSSSPAGVLYGIVGLSLFVSRSDILNSKCNKRTTRLTVAADGGWFHFFNFPSQNTIFVCFLLDTPSLRLDTQVQTFWLPLNWTKTPNWSSKNRSPGTHGRETLQDTHTHTLDMRRCIHEHPEIAKRLRISTSKAGVSASPAGWRSSTSTEGGPLRRRSPRHCEGGSLRAGPMGTKNPGGHLA